MELFSTEWEGIALRMLQLQGDALPLPALTEDEQVLLQSLHAESRRREWLATRRLVQHVLPGNIICYTEHGKPNLSQFEGGFSISHSSSYAAIAYSETAHNLAIDVETVSPRVVRVKHKFLTASEHSYCSPEDETFLTVMWCAKEVMFKLMENGSMDFESHYRIEPFELADSGELAGIYCPEGLPETHIRMYYQQIGQTIAVLGKPILTMP